MYFSIWDSNINFLKKSNIVIYRVLMCFIERGTQNCILNYREIFRWRETVLRAQGMKSDENLFFCQI